MIPVISDNGYFLLFPPKSLSPFFPAHFQVGMVGKFLYMRKVIGDIFHQFLLFKAHDQLIAVPLAGVKEIGLVEIREVFGHVLKVLDEIVFSLIACVVCQTMFD